MNFFDILENH